ncbi:MAG: TetR/AcrR family transcriptional regulator [Myxococcales bacterium]|nr:TetR/AcrR family transcriptional regulator [Myxococcales bacterium]
MGEPLARHALRQARRDVTRQHLLEAAERVFAARGYDGTRMQDVAAEAGLALGTLYGLVPGKEELYAEIHRTRGRALLARAAEAAARPGSAVDALLGGVAAYVAFLVEHPTYLHLHLAEGQPWALAPRFRSEEQRAQWREGLALTAQVFRAAIGEGTVVDEDPETLARLMIASHQVLLARWVEDGMREPPAALVQRMQQHLRRAFLRRGARASQPGPR